MSEQRGAKPDKVRRPKPAKAPKQSVEIKKTPDGLFVVEVRNDADMTMNDEDTVGTYEEALERARQAFEEMAAGEQPQPTDPNAPPV